MKQTLRWILTGVILVLPRLAAADKAPPPRVHHHDGPPGAHVGANQPMVHRFENPADWTAKFDGPERDAWQKPQELVKRLQIAPGMTVADIGAGTGYLMPHLAAATGDKGRVIAVDIEPKMVQHLTDRAKKAKLSLVTAQLGEPGIMSRRARRTPRSCLRRCGQAERSTSSTSRWTRRTGRPRSIA